MELTLCHREHVRRLRIDAIVGSVARRHVERRHVARRVGEVRVLAEDGGSGETLRAVLGAGAVDTAAVI